MQPVEFKQQKGSCPVGYRTVLEDDYAERLQSQGVIKFIPRQNPKSKAKPAIGRRQTSTKEA